MRYLADTHTLIWAIYSKERLSQTVRDILTNKNSTVFVSSIAFWEIAIKHSIGKAILHGVLPDEIPQIAKNAGFRILALTDELLATSYKLNFAEGHRDPFDRLTLWQAIQSNLTLLSKDSQYAQYERLGLKLLW